MATKRSAGRHYRPARLKESLREDRGWAAARPKSRHRKPAHTGAFFKFTNRLRSQKKTTCMLSADSLSRTRHVHLPAHSVHKDSANFYAEYPPKETNTRGSRKQLWNLLPKGGFSAEILHEPSSTNILKLVAVNSPAAHLIRSEDEAVSTEIIKVKPIETTRKTCSRLSVYSMRTRALPPVRLPEHHIRLRKAEIKRSQSEGQESDQAKPPMATKCPVRKLAPFFWFGRGDQPALSAQTRTHEMYTRVRKNCLLQYYNFWRTSAP